MNTRGLRDFPFQFVVSKSEHCLATAALIVAALESDVGNTASNGRSSLVGQHRINALATVCNGCVIARDAISGLGEIKRKGTDVVYGCIPRPRKVHAIASECSAAKKKQN
jgi:hypothetical protein